MDNLLTIQEVIALYDNKITYSQVMYAILKQTIKAKKIGWIWLIEESSLPQEWPTRGKKNAR
jgi:hypothetical protein